MTGPFLGVLLNSAHSHCIQGGTVMEVALIRALSAAAFLLSWKNDPRPLPQQDELSLCLGEGDCEGPHLILPGIPSEGGTLEEALEAFVKNPQVQEVRISGASVPEWVNNPSDNVVRISQENAVREFTARARKLFSEITEGTDLAKNSSRIIVRIRRTVIPGIDARGHTQEKKGFIVLLELRGFAPVNVTATGERVDTTAEEAIRMFRRELASRQKKG
ncbi:MAG: hypothetical protein WDZ44_02150 [Candidatus Spechtbacterales bacterium]